MNEKTELLLWEKPRYTSYDRFPNEGRWKRVEREQARGSGIAFLEIYYKDRAGRRLSAATNSFDVPYPLPGVYIFSL